MQRTLAYKLATIGLMVALLMIALSTIGHLVAERQARRNEVIQDIARSSSGEQQLAGPILVIPYERTVRQWRENDRGERHLEEREVSGQLHLLPEDFLLDGDIRTELRARGIYEARLYHARLRVKADFAVPLHYGVGADIGTYRFGHPFIAMGVTDIRGIEAH
jgi:inner membrane protein